MYRQRKRLSKPTWRKNEKIYFMIAVLLTVNLIGHSFAADDTSLTLVVGNTRKAGGVNTAVAELVGQNEADFTHTQSFGGKVVSIDRGIPPKSLSKKKYPHLCVDFVETPPSGILGKLGNVHPACVFFEWFPSCVIGEPGKTITPLLLPALKNAFEILAPEGKVIIDHLPYTLSLPDDSRGGFEKLNSIQANTAHLKEALGTELALLRQPGFISRRLQMADPFTLHVCRTEHQEIRNCLMFRVKNNDLPFNDAECKFIKDADINNMVCEFASSFGREDKKNLMAEICNGMLLSYKGEHEELQGYWDLFEQHYYMKTRGPLVLNALRDIGFTVTNDAIQYYAENPYNKRKHAWLITATKP